MDYLFRLAKEEEICQIFELYLQRVSWMDEVGISQWNKTGYLEAYPKEHYEAKFAEGNLYVFQKKDDGAIVGAVVLLQVDERWPDKEDDAAYYVRNLVTSGGESGVGKIFLDAIEKYALENGKSVVRIDGAVDNTFLNAY